MLLTSQQLEVIYRPLGERCFLEGKVGCGKTSTAVERVLYLMEAGVPAHQILIYLPQRTLARPYQQALAVPGVMAGGAVTILTLGGLAKRTIETFWPLVVEQAGFGQPREWPIFLTLETAQYFMAKLVRPLLEKGFFASVNLPPNRLYSQILDNLNKAALVGFPHTEIGERLKSAWNGSPGQLRVYEDVQTCANLFRQFCLEHNLLDFSLQVEVFVRYLWPHPLVRQTLQSQYRHLIADNLEEDAPVSHDLLREWLPGFDSALLIYDHDGGYRVFLGADPVSAYSLKQACNIQRLFDTSFVTDPPLQRFERTLLWTFGAQPLPSEAETGAPAIFPLFERFYPQMLERVAEEVARCIDEEGISPAQIVVLTPYLTDALRFALAELLERRRVRVRSHRPSRALREEPVIRCLLTLAALAYPEGLPPDLLREFDLTTALLQAIEGLDLVRARLLTAIVLRKENGLPTLSSFEQIQAETQERITYRIGERYERLRRWLEDARATAPEELEVFFVRLFDELLSQRGYGFYRNEQAGELTANLVESARKFRQVFRESMNVNTEERNREYLRLVSEGVIAAQYLRSWQAEDEEAVLLSPAYTYLLSNRPVEVQFWLDIGSSGWYERLFQPLTQPYVLSRRWSKGRVWTAAEEAQAAEENLRRITLGLVRRCRRRIYLGYSEYSVGGYEQRGDLLRVLQDSLEMMARGTSWGNSGRTGEG
ncbi:MAG: hypothetical protein RML93_06870 [Anaerolineales bacterium]|nr:hypothetical protein [Anaerolineales bacterium]MDW8446994.1 hypothetical protein [Anaerolineales bacterium]